MSPRGGYRPGAGRKPAGDPRSAHLHVRVSGEKLAAWREAAARAGVGMTEWVEAALDRAAALEQEKEQP